MGVCSVRVGAGVSSGVGMGIGSGVGVGMGSDGGANPGSGIGMGSAWESVQHNWIFDSNEPFALGLSRESLDCCTWYIKDGVIHV